MPKKKPEKHNFLEPKKWAGVLSLISNLYSSLRQKIVKHVQCILYKSAHTHTHTHTYRIHNNF